MDEQPVGVSEELKAELVDCIPRVAVPRDELIALLDRLDRAQRLEPHSRLMADAVDAMKVWLNS